MPGFSQTFLTAIIIYIPLLKNRCQATVMELAVTQQGNNRIYIDRNLAAAVKQLINQRLLARFVNPADGAT